MNFHFNKKFQNYFKKNNSDYFASKSFLAGGLAGTISTGLTYPLDFLRTRLGVDSHRDIK